MAYFRLERDGAVATLTFDWEAKRNALNEETLLELEAQLHRVRDDPDVRVLVFTGTGNTFSAGADLRVLDAAGDRAERERAFAAAARKRIRILARACELLVRLEQPTIAAVNGYAVGGGWELALACDLRIAVEEAEFWFPEVDLGVPLSPDATALLVRHVGPAVAKEMILTCRRYRAAELVPLGLLNRVVPRSGLDAAVRELAAALAAKTPSAVMGAKATVNALTSAGGVVRPDLLWTRD